jgi:hypothetical protein
VSNIPGASRTWKRGSRLTQKPFAEAAASMVPIDVDLDLAGGALLDAGLHSLEVLVCHVVDCRLRQLHRELLRTRQGRGEHTACHDAGGGECLQGRVHWIGPPKLVLVYLASR